MAEGRGGGRGEEDRRGARKKGGRRRGGVEGGKEGQGMVGELRVKKGKEGSKEGREKNMRAWEQLTGSPFTAGGSSLT